MGPAVLRTFSEKNFDRVEEWTCPGVPEEISSSLRRVRGEICARLWRFHGGGVQLSPSGLG
jgi:hypothetical protein